MLWWIIPGSWMISVSPTPREGGIVKYFCYGLDIFSLTINAANCSSDGTNFPFWTLWDGGWSDPGDCCTPHRVRDSFTIHWGRIHLIRNGVDLAASACRSRFRSHLRKAAAMPQQIGGGCSSPEYRSSTYDGVKIGDVVSKKLTLSFHITSKMS